jgi:hypothetical protein
MQTLKKYLEYLLIFFGLCLIVIHGLFPNQFVIDGFSILIFVIISIPVLADFLKKAKIIGAEFEFKDAITATEKLVDLSVKNAAIESKKTDKCLHPPQFEVFDIIPIKELIESDRVLALAALRIEIEKKLRLAANQLGFPQGNAKSTFNFFQFLMKRGSFHTEQIEAIKQILQMCNKAIHGFEVSQEEAEIIIELAEKLNKSFPVGYSINFNPNIDYEKQGFFCEWEHCIEQFPLQEEPNKKSCPVFGHDCPGGVDKIKNCGKNL